MKKSHSLEEKMVRALRSINRGVDLYSRELLQKHGLTGPQLATLCEVKRLQPVSAGVLAREVQIGAATLTGILDRLEERALVQRSRDRGDRRSVSIRVTDEGVRLAEAVPSLLQCTLYNKLGELEEWERTLMLSVLQRLASMMDPTGVPADATADQATPRPARGRPAPEANPTDPPAHSDSLGMNDTPPNSPSA